MKRMLLVCTGLAVGCAASLQQWTTHKDPSGFSVEVPPKWTVAADAKSGRVDLRGPGTERAVLWPVFIPSALEAGSAAQVLRRLAVASGIEAEWGTPQLTGAAAVKLLGRAGGRATVAVLTWAASPRGTAGYFYAASASENVYRASEETFARVLSSFRVAGTSGTAAGPPPAEYQRWNDPRENAFSLEVPAGWKVSGGLFRFASVDTRGAFQAVSPDGIRITGGDAELPSFTEPNQMLAFSGFREGSWYSPGYGVRMMVRRYTPGTAFAREYVSSRVAQGCAELTFTENRDRPDAAAGINAVYQQFSSLGVQMYLTAGEAAFTCRQNGLPMAGYYFAAVLRTQSAGMPGGLWKPEYLFGFIAPAEKTKQAQAALEHAVKSFEINPQWAAMQQNITANTSQIVSRTNAEISQIISSSYNNRQQVMDELSRRRSNATLGVVDVTDEATGRQIKVENSSNYYWIDQRGAIVGTETDTRPSLDFRALTKLP